MFQLDLPARGEAFHVQEPGIGYLFNVERHSKKETVDGLITVEQNTKESKKYNCSERDQIGKTG